MPKHIKKGKVDVKGKGSAMMMGGKKKPKLDSDKGGKDSAQYSKLKSNPVHKA